MFSKLMQILGTRLTCDEDADELEFLTNARDAITTEIDNRRAELDTVGDKIDVGHVLTMKAEKSDTLGMAIQSYCESCVGAKDLDAAGEWLYQKTELTDATSIEYLSNLAYRPNPLAVPYPKLKVIYNDIGMNVKILQQRLASKSSQTSSPPKSPHSPTRKRRRKH